MNQINERRFQWGRNHLTLILAILGAGIVVGSVLAKSFVSGAVQPGKLVAKEESLIWRNPAEEPGRKTGANDAHAEFEIKNVGGSTVHILEVESSCGCATPTVEPRSIAPGGTGIVEVHAATPLVGEKTAMIVLKTDSSLSPEVVLQLRVMSNRRPPFMHQANGDLNFEGESLMDEVREIHVFTLELADSTPTPPPVETASSILEIRPAKLEKEQTIPEFGAISRHYVYEVKLAIQPPTGMFSEEVVIVDPWDSSLLQRLRVHGEVRPAIRTVPGRLVLRRNARQDHQDVAEQVLVVAVESISDLVVEVDRTQASPLVVGEVQYNEDGRQATFSVGLGPGITKSGEYQILVGRSSSSD